MIFQETHLQKVFKDSLKNELKINGLQLFDKNYKKLSDNPTSTILKKNENSKSVPLFPIKVASPEKITKKTEMPNDSNLAKLQILRDLLNSSEEEIKGKTKMHMNDSIKNIVLSNLTLQDQSSDKDKKIFPNYNNSNKIGKFQKTLKLFEEIK